MTQRGKSYLKVLKTLLLLSALILEFNREDNYQFAFWPKKQGNIRLSVFVSHSFSIDDSSNIAVFTKNSGKINKA